MTYEIFQAIECLQNLLEYNGPRDAHLIFKMEAIILDENDHNESRNEY